MSKISDEEIEIAKERIIHLLTVNHGLKSNDLLIKISQDYLLLSGEDVSKIIHELVQKNEIKRIEYILEDHSGSIFTFYLPGSSRIL